MTPMMESKKQVQFEEVSNETYEIPRHDREQWYSARDYNQFYLKLEGSRIESVTLSNSDQKETIHYPMEFYETFGTSCSRRSKRKLCKRIMRHQASCREKGVLDPEGLSRVSMTMSEDDIERALRLAASNAYETECYRSEEKEEDDHASYLTEEFPILNYYYETVHPYLTSPMQLLTKTLLCECD